MRAMVIKRPSEIESRPFLLKDVKNPRPSEGEILVKVKVCGICRTDIHIAEGDLPFPGHDVVPGHEIVGIVEETGKSASRFKKGDRVGIAWLRHTCGECGYCTTGKENLCEKSLYTGYNAPGGYAEYTVVDEDFAYKIPENFSDEEAAPLLCAGIIGYRSLKRSELKPGRSLAIYGFGGSAHIVIQIAKYWKCPVYVVSRTREHQKLAKSLEADWVGEDASKMPEKVDSAIIFAPAGDILPAALENLKKGGTVSLAGVYMSKIPAMDYEKHLFYEKNIRSTTSNTRKDGEELLKIASEIPIKLKTTSFHLEEANEALIKLKHGEINGAAVLMI